MRSTAEHAAAVRSLLEGSPWCRRAPKEVELARARGRVLAEDFAAPVSLPPFDNAQMDGYAIRAADTLEEGGAADFVTLLVAATGAAGHVPGALPGFGAAPVMTGAPIPEGADAVVPVEEAEPQAFLGPDHTVRVPADQPAGRFVRRAGEDVVADEPVLAAGPVLTPAALGVLAAFGLERIRVRPVLRTGLLTTGDEVVEPGQELEPAKIHNANAPLLRALLESMGVQVVVVRHVVDDDAALRELLRQEAPGAAWGDSRTAGPDLWVSSGGISEGAFEVVRRVLSDDRAAESSEFLHVALQPGGPQGLALVGGIPVVCFPGNPVSSWVSAEMLLRPALTALGSGARAHRRITARTADELTPLPGHTRVVRARWDGEQAHRVGGYGSHLLVAAAQADALIVLEPGSEPVPAGSEVELRLLE